MWGFFKRKSRPTAVLVVDHDAVERQRMKDKQRDLQRKLGISAYDDVQSWLRLHEILSDYEDRIAALEGKK